MTSIDNRCGLWAAAILLASAAALHAQFPPADTPLGPGQLVSYTVEWGGSSACPSASSSQTVPRGQALPLLQFTCHSSEFASDESVEDVTTTIAFTGFEFTGDHPTPPATVVKSTGLLTFDSPLDRTINLAARYTVTAAKPLKRAKTGVFYVAHLQIPGQNTVDRGPVATNPGGPVIVSFDDRRQIPALFALSSEDGKYVINPVTITFYEGAAGSEQLRSLFLIRVTANYLFTPGTGCFAACPLVFVKDSSTASVSDPAQGFDPTKLFPATVRYDFSKLTLNQGEIALRMYDSADPNKRVLQASSDFVPHFAERCGPADTAHDSS